MAENATNADEAVVVNDDKPVTEDDLRSLKYPDENVEPSNEVDEPSDGDEDTAPAEETESAEEQTPEAVDEDLETQPSEFVKEFQNIKGDTPEEYARNLETAYKNSTAEAMRLKDQIAPAPDVNPVIDNQSQADEQSAAPAQSPTELYFKQKMDKEITDAYADFRKDFNQVEDIDSYQKFSRTVSALSRTIMETEDRLAPPDELYRAAAVILRWEKTSEPNDKEKLGMALKQNSAASKNSSSPSAPAPRSKVTQAMLDTNKKMYPGKTDDEIRKELEPYV